MKASFFSMIVLILSPALSWGKTVLFTPSLKEVSAAAQDAVQAKISAPENAKIVLTPQTLDKRFQRPRCVSPITASLVSEKIKRNNTVKLSCKTQKAYPWQIYLSVTVNIQYQVAVATKTLSSGELIDKNKVVLKYVNEYAVRGTHYDSIKTIIGTKAKKRIAKGHPIFKQNICFVCKGDNVKIIAQTNSFSIRTNGTAQSDGNLHDTIKVMNNKSNNIIKAEVIGVGEVRVKM